MQASDVTKIAPNPPPVWFRARVHSRSQTSLPDLGTDHATRWKVRTSRISSYRVPAQARTSLLRERATGDQLQKHGTSRTTLRQAGRFRWTGNRTARDRCVLHVSPKLLPTNSRPPSETIIECWAQ